MYWEQSTIQAFHSIVPGSVMEFYKSVGVSRSVASRPESEFYALRSLLSVRWVFDYAQLPDDVQLYRKDEADFFLVDGETAMPGYSFYDTQNGYHIYENDLYIPMGFFYDGYITRSEYDALDEWKRQFVLLKALVVEDEDAAEMTIPHLRVSDMAFDEETYALDCYARAENTASSFTVDNGGFTATVTAAEDNWVFFSVPYENGWSATVDGKAAAIKKVNVGFMAIKCPAGKTVEVRFDYETPGLKVGAYVSGGALLLLLVYWVFAILHNRKLNKLAAELPAVEIPTQSVITPTKGEFDLYSIYQPNEDASDNETEPE